AKALTTDTQHSGEVAERSPLTARWSSYVYIGTLVDSVHKVVGTLRSDHGEFILAMLYNSGGLNSTSSWNLIVSSFWTDETGKFDATHIIAQALHDGLDSEH